MCESLAAQFLGAALQTACPIYSHLIWIGYSEVTAQTAATCPCCYTQIG
ncbi:hypothetical protein ACFWIJ_18595 [Streptomyces sp. NPDC127079]